MPLRQVGNKQTKLHCVKCVRIRSFSGSYLPAFELNTEQRDTKYISVFNPNAGKCGPEKLRIRTPFTQCWLLTELTPQLITH